VTSELVDFTSAAPVSGDLSSRCIHGTRGRGTPADPKIQVHAYDPHSYVLRQSKAVSYNDHVAGDEQFAGRLACGMMTRALRPRRS
jgi:hypothetical protein